MHKRLLSASLILMTFAGAGVAQQESLLIGAGDQLHIQVFDTPEMEQHPRVTDAGTVPLLFVGDIKLAGMTPGDAAHVIEDILKQKQYMLNPHVAVTVEEYATQQVSVLGEVKTAGTYDITAPAPIISILSKAGGLTELADRNITIERHADPARKVNYYLSNRSDDAISNQVLVYPGDTVLVPKVGVVYVLGDVGRPGGFPMSTNDSTMTIMQALALAGTANKTAILSKAKLIRKTPNGLLDIPVELAEIQKGKKADVVLQPNDVLFVPFSWMKNMGLASASIATSEFRFDLRPSLIVKSSTVYL